METNPKTVYNGVDRISELSDDLLVKVLSFLPTKVVVSTTILSKRWEFLWMWLPKLDLVFSRSHLMNVNRVKNFSSFLVRSLPLYRAPVIENFHLCLSCDDIKPEDIKLSIVIALSRYLHELEIGYGPYGPNSEEPHNILPSSLYNCKTLVTLKLGGEILLDVPRMVCLPSLKTLELDVYRFLDGKSLGRLLSICPALEHLTVRCGRDYDYMGLVTIVVPSLQRLTFCITRGGTHRLFDKLMINTPSLKYLCLKDLDEDDHPFSIANMPNLEDAYVDFRYFDDISSRIGSITSVKRLTICSENVYGDGFVFNQLEHLKLCVCSENSSNLLVRFLQDSPNLRVLDILQMDHHDYRLDGSLRTVDESILSTTLEAFNWSRYLERRPQESDLAIYILGKRWSPNDCNNLV